MKAKKEKIKKNKNEEDKINTEIEENIKKEKNKQSKGGFPYKLINKKNINHILQFLIKFYKFIKPNSISLNLILGFSDPYYNGLILAYYSSLKGAYKNLPINITVNWQKEVSKGQGKISGKFVPISILFSILFFIFSPQTLKILWQYYKFKKQ